MVIGKDFEVKGHLALWIILPFELEEEEDEEGEEEDEEEGGGMLRGEEQGSLHHDKLILPHSSLSFFLVLIQSEWLHARLSTDWAEMQIHSESRASVRMKEKQKKDRHPRSSSAHNSARNKEDVIALAAATEKRKNK